jgi:hypothetical protein
MEKGEATQKRTLTVVDARPVQPGDSRGLTGFYLVIGWTVGGYLVAALLGIAKGARPANGKRAVIRLVAIALYAIVSGLGGAIIVGPALGALNGHLVALWWVGALVVFAAAAVTMAFEVLLGVIGIGIAVLLFVVLGNPSAGGAFSPALLPPFWRAIGGSIPNGAATAAVRNIVYFGGNDIAGHLLVIAAYAWPAAQLLWPERPFSRVAPAPPLRLRQLCERKTTAGCRLTDLAVPIHTGLVGE